jgi:ribosomal protein S18 acetylase RimI-like enzyme
MEVSMNEFEYISGGPELLANIAPLWAKLNQLYSNLSPHFCEVFQRRVFRDRKKELIAKSQTGSLRVDIARSNNGVDIVGYRVSTVNSEGEGEIDSIFVEEQYRCQGVAQQLMKSALAWMNSLGVTKKHVLVAFRNDKALYFYEKFGFYPANFELIQKITNP